jgi:hypothetical protein
MCVQDPMAIDVSPEALRLGEMKVTGRLVDATNATMLASVTHDATEIMCIYKPIAGERPLWDFSDGTLAYREYAAYLISARCKFGLVPLTVLRDGPFGEGAVQLWKEIDESIGMIEYFQRDTAELRNMALFDAVINNTDRKIGHILPTANGDVFGCDHGVTFHTDNKLRTVLWRWAGNPFSEEELTRLRTVSDFINETSELSNLLTGHEIEALGNRVDMYIESGVFPSPTKDWPSVPWPPY